MNAVAFSPDGRWLASGGYDGRVKIWEPTRGREYRTIAAYGDSVNAVAYSPDGRWLASGRGYVKLLDAATGREVRTMAEQTEYPAVRLDLTFSPDGRWLASGSTDKTVKVWEVSSGREVHTMVGHTKDVWGVAFSADGHRLASGSLDGTIKLWEVETGRQLRTMDAKTDQAGVAFSPDGRLLVSGGRDGMVRLWDAATGSEVRALAGHSDKVFRVRFSPDGLWLASAGREGTIKLWETGTGRELQTLTGHKDAIRGIAFSPDGRWLASGSADSTIKLWNLATGRATLALEGRVHGVSSVAFRPDTRWLATGSEDSTVKLWSLAMGREPRILVGHKDAISAVVFSQDGRLLASVSEDKTVKLWEVDAIRELANLTGHQGEVGTVAFHPNGRWLASVSGRWSKNDEGDKTIKLWEVNNGHELRTLARHEQTIMTFAFSPDGLRLASGSRDTSVKLWDVETGRELQRLTGHKNAVRAIAFSPDGRWLASGSDDSTVRLWEVETGRELRTLSGHGSAVLTVAFTPDGRRLASGSADNTVRLWEANTGRELHTLASHTGYVWSVAFSADERWLVSVGDGSARIWDAASGEELASLVATKTGDDWMVVTPDGLFDGSEQGMQTLVSWRIGDRVYPADRFFADYYTPGLLARLFAGERPKPTVDMASVKLPPDVRIASPAGGARVKEQRAAVTVEVKDLGGGVGEVRLYHNGKLGATHEAIPGMGSKYSFEVDLVPGENILKAVALSKERVESNEDTVRVVYEAAESKPALHLLVVGVNRYEDQSFNLGFARQDGEALAQFFEKHGSRLFSAIQATRLFDKQATQANIRKALEQLTERARSTDVVMLYMAGHGVGLGQQFYFLPHEMRQEENEQAAIRKYGVPATALADALRRIPALKQLLILDTCQAETALPILAKAVMFRGLAEEKATKMLARSNGLYLIAAATKQQYAVEVPDLGHGVLAYALLKGLGEKGEPAALSPSGEFVSISSLLAYVNEQVPELTEKYHEGNKQYPVSFNTGMDFPLVVR